MKLQSSIRLVFIRIPMTLFVLAADFPYLIEYYTDQ
jgi:hypothetical protein